MGLGSTGERSLSTDEYDLVLEAAETYREALVVRLCGEAGLRPAELTRLRPGDVAQVRSSPPRYLLWIPPADDERVADGRAEGDSVDDGRADGESVDDERTDVDEAAARADLERDRRHDGSHKRRGTGGSEASRGAGRTAYLPSEVAREVRRYARSNGIDDDEPILSVTPRRLQMIVADVTDRAAEIGDDESLASISTDDLRRFFARRTLSDLDVNPRVVKRVGGWRSFESLEPYLAAPTDDEIVRAFEPLERDGDGGPSPTAGGDRGALGAVLEATDGLALVRLDADGYVERWNRAASATFGYDGAAIVGTHVSTFYTEEAVADGVPERTLAAALDDRGHEREGWRVRADGTRFRAREIVAPLRDETGRHEGYAVLVRDVTGRHERLRSATAGRREYERRDAVATRHRELTRALLDSSTHQEVETSACEALVDGDAYAVAWIDRTLRADSGHEWRTAAGIEPAAVDEFVARLEDGDQVDDVGRADAVLSGADDAATPGRSASAGEGDPGRSGADEASDPGWSGNGGTRAEGGVGNSREPPVDGPESTEAATADELTGEDRPLVRVVRDVAMEREDGGRFEGDVAVVRLTSGETVYGRLWIATDRRGAFDDWERAWTATTGRQIGYAIAATRQRTLLLSDALLEFDVRCRDDDAFFVALSAALDCQFELVSLVELSESTKLFYLDLRNCEPGAVFEYAADHPDVDGCRLVETREDGWRIEVTVSGSAPALTLIEYGATVTEAVYEDGEGRLTAECAPDADLRAIVGGLRSSFPETELGGKREVERSVRTAREFRRGIEARLTDKQEAALRAAYFGGYYDWPRESTAEEVADSMGVSSPTLHNHLRKGQHELLRTIFDRDSFPE